MTSCSIDGVMVGALDHMISVRRGIRGDMYFVHRSGITVPSVEGSRNIRRRSTIEPDIDCWNS